MPDTHDERGGDEDVVTPEKAAFELRYWLDTRTGTDRLGRDVGIVLDALAAATARAEEAEARLAKLGKPEVEQRIVSPSGLVYEPTLRDLENQAYWVPGVRLEERQVYPTPWREAANAAQDGRSATAKERIGACMEAKIRPAMLANLPDAYLRGKLGTERINKWADWISATLTACLNGDGTGEALEAPLPQYKREPKAATTERVPCAFCGSPMTRSLARPSKKYCSDLCNKRDFDARSGVRTAGLTSRARNGGFTIIEEVDPDVVFERDRGICYLCDQPVDRGAGLTAEGPTVDHVIPTSKGGVHSYANVKLTHRRCNSRKNNRIIDIIGFELRDQPSVTPNDTTGADR